MDDKIYPQGVDFNYKVRCDKHQFSPYVYCEICMIRTQLQTYIEEGRKELSRNMASYSLALSVLNDITEKQIKQIDELQIQMKLLRKK